MGLPGLMIAISVSSGVLLISVSSLQLAREDFLHHHQLTALEDSATYVLQIISRTVQQATRDRVLSSSEQSSGALPFDSALGVAQGIDNARIGSAGMAVGPGIHGSDVLIIGLNSVWGEVIDCAGFVRPEDPSASADVGWVMFYIASGPDGEPELYCRYRGHKQWESQAIASGIECFHVLFGLDQDDDGLPNQFLSATALANYWSSGRAGNSTSEREASVQEGPGPQVVAVHVALVLRSAMGGGKPLLFQNTDLFGRAYTDASAESDVGTATCPAGQDASLRSRSRRRVDAVIFLSNRESPK